MFQRHGSRRHAMRAALSNLRLAAFAVVLLATEAALGYWGYVRYAGDFLEERKAQLESIAVLESARLSQWLAERLADARTISGDTDFGARVKDAMASASGPAHDAVHARLQLLKHLYGYSHATIAEAGGRILSSTSEPPVPLKPEEIEALGAALGRDAPVVSAVHRMEGGQHDVDVAAPLHAPGGERLAAAVLFEIETDKLLAARSLDARMASAETLLVRAAGDRVYYLNGVRRPQALARESAGTGHGDEIAARALHGAQGVVTGSDYAGVAVLAAMAPVPGTDWIVIAKVDAREAYGLIRYRASLLIAGFLTMLLLAAVAVYQTVRRRQAAERLRGQEERARLAAIVDSADDAIVSTSLERIIQSWNPAAERLFGYTAAEALGRPLRMVMPPDADEDVEGSLARVAGGETVKSHDVVRLTRDGRRIDVSVTRSPIMDDAGRVIGVARIYRDIGQQKRAAAAQARLAAIVEHSNDAMVTRTMDGIVTSWNAGASRMFGHSAEEAMGRHVSFLHAPGSVPAIDWSNEQLRRGDSIAPFRSERITRDGRTIDVLTSLSPVRGASGEVEGASLIFQDISQLRRAEIALSRSEERLRAAFDQAAACMALRSADPVNPRWLRVNQKMCEVLGYTEAELLQLTSLDITPPEDREDSIENSRRLFDGRVPAYTRDKRYVRRDGTAIWVNLSLSMVRDEEGRPLHVMTVFEDITDKRRTEEQLRLSALAFGSIADGVMITNAADRIVSVNKAFTHITGYAEEDVLGKAPGVLHSEKQDAAFYQALQARLDRDGHWQGEIWSRRRNGEVYPQLLSISALKDEAGAVSHYVSVFNDISQFKAYEEHLEYLAHHDPLTGLPNRALLEDRVERAIAGAERRGDAVALLFVDLDRFKLINDTLGHAIGDELLIAIAKRLGACVRASDTVSRHGGDEFLVLLPGIRHVDEAARIAEKLMDEVSRPYSIGGHELAPSVSVGIAVYPENGEHMSDLLRNADAAMYSAKEQGRNRYQFYTQSMNVRARERLSLETELRTAVERGEFHLVFQPQFELATRRVVGMEALLRWMHPQRGEVPPAAFIPVAEESGLIVKIGEWVLRAACSENRRLREAGVLDVPMAVNVSAIQFRRAQFAAMVAAVLTETGLPAGRLELEVTESVVMEGPEAIAATLQELHQQGVRLTIDDFGKGYSSLSYLRYMPIHQLKIDQAFVRDLPDNKDSAVITQTIATMARSLGLSVVAEGVEREDQLQHLRASACDKAQGYLLCAPLRADALEAWLCQYLAAQPAA